MYKSYNNNQNKPQKYSKQSINFKIHWHSKINKNYDPKSELTTNTLNNYQQYPSLKPIKKILTYITTYLGF